MPGATSPQKGQLCVVAALVRGSRNTTSAKSGAARGTNHHGSGLNGSYTPSGVSEKAQEASSQKLSAHSGSTSK